MQVTFTYDDTNRLTGITLKRPSGQDLYCSATYDDLGRMTSKQDVVSVNGTPQVTSLFSLPSFNATKVHALSQAQTSDGIFPSVAQTVTYTGFDKVSLVKQGKDSLCYAYGYDRQRILMEEHFDNTLRTKRYVGNCEYVTETEGNMTVEYSNTYLTGPYGVFAVAKRSGGFTETYYVLKDNLGSWTAITNETGVLKRELSYDAWGNLRNPDSWATYTVADLFDKPVFDRGFTGHEHYDFMHLINANARLYDPVIGRFFSPDSFVQVPDFTQSYNRYSYCLNNPVMYSDADGEYWHIIAAAVIGGVVNLYSNWDNIDNFWEGLSSFTVGAGSGALTAVNPLVGSVVGSASISANNEITKTTGQGNGFKDVDWGNVACKTAIGAGTGVLSFGAGKFVSNLKIGNTPIAEKILDVCGIKEWNARTIIGNAFNGTLAGGLSGATSGIVNGATTGNWDVWNYTWRGAAYGCAGGVAYSGITTLGYQMQLKYGKLSNLNSDITELASYSIDNSINNLNNYETPKPTLGVFTLQEITIIPTSQTSATVYLPALYHPNLVPPTSYQYNSPTFYRLIPLLRIP